MTRSDPSSFAVVSPDSAERTLIADNYALGPTRAGKAMGCCAALPLH